ncbi:Serine/threonine protein kinase [Parasponia andersonii]|uniref:Receptor-like serine/threonine-protein kinase n=1 Tax=Parasponia andersonii TaxID=3476 RepID=A0A2P5B1R8_PARAD|nr:Serine/threonine protein kinase [Parasponia andersonii]
MMIAKLLAFSLFLNLFCCSILFCKSYALDTLLPGETLGRNRTLVSPGGVFELGFFPNRKVPKQYLGIWFKNDKYKKAAWVANQDSPLVDNSAFMYISDDGNLVISDIRGLTTIVNNRRAPIPSGNTSCRLLDSGNLVLMEGEVKIWQSFDSPTDTFLPGMKLGLFNLNKSYSTKQFLTSWLSPLDPTKGNFIFGMDDNKRTQFKIWGPTDGKSQEIGFWDGQKLILFFQTKSTNYTFSFVSNSKEVYLTFSNNGDSNGPSSWFELAPNGDINELIMVGKEISVLNHSMCDNGLATISTECLRLSPLHCWNGDEFSEIKGIFPNSMTATFPVRMGLDDCELTCKSNCSCTAYASFNGDNNICLLYYGDKNLPKLGRGSDNIYVRGDAIIESHHRRITNMLLKILVPIMSTLILFIIIFFLCYLRRRKSTQIGIDMSQSGLRKSLRLLSRFLGSKGTNKDKVRNEQELSREDIRELPLLSFSCVSDSTDNFSLANKLGEGGFGPVYKGKLLGHDIAVKRLSKSSGQGFEEFRNEVHLISELQHRNLVKLVGYCIHQEEKILIYEYMANKSLDSFIFGRKRGTALNWGQRMHIIEGIAQGLLYLHKYSRLRVIHRDLKTSNILLDAHMNPKISDFGMARICQENESQGVTKRVVGTYGYMSPEYAVHGHFSTKSDVFSYGVILLEIVSGRKNTTTFECLNHSLSLLGYAWNLWKDDRGGELMDPTLADSCRMSELQLCIHVALLCVQENPEDRPAMSDVVSMLSIDTSLLPAPKKPALSTYMSLADVDSPRRLDKKPSHFSVTISALEAR